MSQICLNNVEKDVEGLNLLEVTKQRLFSESNFQASNMKQPQLQTIFNPGLINSVDSCGGLPPQKKTSQATSA